MEALLSSWILALVSGWITLWIGQGEIPQWFKRLVWVSTGVFFFYFVVRSL